MSHFYFISPLVLQTFIWPIVRPMFWFFGHLKVSGLQNLGGLGKGVIFAANHSGELDPILIPASLPFLSRFMPMFYTSRQKDFYKNCGWRQRFYGGFFFKIWGSHPLQCGKRDYETSLKTHIDILEHGGSVCIFPEGKTTPDGEIQKEVHGGVAYLSLRTNHPIVPVRIKGDFKMTLSDFFLRRRKLEVIFGLPLPASIIAKANCQISDDYKTGATMVMNAITAL